MTLTTLVTGHAAADRETAIANAVDPNVKTFILLEGFPRGTAALDELALNPDIKISYIAAGCPCCAGNLVMRVTLTRMLRNPPRQLFLGLASAQHLEQLRTMLSNPPYAGLLMLTEDLHA